MGFFLQLTLSSPLARVSLAEPRLGDIFFICLWGGMYVVITNYLQIHVKVREYFFGGKKKEKERKLKRLKLFVLTFSK